MTSPNGGVERSESVHTKETPKPTAGPSSSSVLSSSSFPEEANGNSDSNLAPPTATTTTTPSNGDDPSTAGANHDVSSSGTTNINNITHGNNNNIADAGTNSSKTNQTNQQPPESQPPKSSSSLISSMNPPAPVVPPLTTTSAAAATTTTTTSATSPSSSHLGRGGPHQTHPPSHPPQMLLPPHPHHPHHHLYYPYPGVIPPPPPHPYDPAVAAAHHNMTHPTSTTGSVTAGTPSTAVGPAASGTKGDSSKDSAGALSSTNNTQHPVPPHHSHAAAAYHRHNAAAAAAWAEAAAAAAAAASAAYPGYHPHHHFFSANASYKTAAALAAEAAANGKKKNPQHPQHHLLHRPPPPPPPPPPHGPYRFSDPTLRREALSRLASEKKDHRPGSSSSAAGAVTAAVSGSAGATNGGAAHGAIPSGPSPSLHAVGMMGLHHPPDPTAAILLELEARGEGATSPSQIEDYHREEVTTMGCTCKKTKCLKLYCQCFAVKIYCGANCRCLNCHNSMQYEVEREDAIRTILSRNPLAFETKFQKNQTGPNLIGLASNPTLDHTYAPSNVGDPHSPSSSAGFGPIIDSLPSRVLSHKLGCKCQKSACMKKYCECYAGSVKCSANCRCVGCKNQPPGGLGNGSPAVGGAIPAAAGHRRDTSTNEGTRLLGGFGKGPRNSGKQEPWMMEVAQNLAFLKHGSPAVEKPRRTLSRDKSESGSVPLLTSSSDESPNSSTGGKSVLWGGGKGVVAKMPPPTTAEQTAVNALLMAAMAMTEMSAPVVENGESNPADSKSPSSEGADVGTKEVAATTPPFNNTQIGNCNNGTPEAHINTEDHFETPQRNLMGKFMSPKRKASETSPTETRSPGGTPMSVDHDGTRGQYKDAIAYKEDDDDDDDDDDEHSPKREHPGDGTPGIQQKIKRSRLGSLKKVSQLMEQQRSNGRRANLGSTTKSRKGGLVPMEMATPAKGKDGSVADLTPVSARCIDFKKMRVNDTTAEETAVDSVTTSI